MPLYFKEICLTYEHFWEIRRGRAAEEDFNQSWPGEAKTQVAEAPRKHSRKQVMSITDRRPVFDTAHLTFCFALFILITCLLAKCSLNLNYPCTCPAGKTGPRNIAQCNMWHPIHWCMYITWHESSWTYVKITLPASIHKKCRSRDASTIYPTCMCIYTVDDDIVTTDRQVFLVHFVVRSLWRMSRGLG